MWKLLFIEDDEICAYTTVGGLGLLGSYEIKHAPNGKKGWELYQSWRPDIVISDVEMPEMSGFELTKHIRKKDQDTLIILATGRQLPKDVVYGFELGIDNYIKKPFVAQELHAHIQALLSIKKTPKRENSINLKNKVPIGKFLLDTERKVLNLQKQEKKLTTTEFDILKLLLDKRGKLVSRNEILIHVWGKDNTFTSRSLDVFISKLRKYLSADITLRITNIRGKGLIFEK